MKFRELFYVPNLIEYFRIYLVCCGLYYRNDWYIVFSFLLDAIDGPIARYLHQTSDLGCFLDHSIDSTTEAILSGRLLLLGTHPEVYRTIELFHIIIQFAHLYRQYWGKNKVHDRHVEWKNPILRLYFSYGMWNPFALYLWISNTFYPLLILNNVDSVLIVPFFYGHCIHLLGLLLRRLYIL